MGYFIHSLKNIFNYRGRARRAEFGWFILVNALINIGVNIAVMLIFTGVELIRPLSEMVVNIISSVAAFSIVALWVYGVISWLVMLSLTARRLHDINLSGWWQLLPLILIAFFTPIMFQLIDNSNYIIGIIILSSLSCLILLFILLFKDGQKHANKYGESPKYPSEPERENQITDLTA